MKTWLAIDFGTSNSLVAAATANGRTEPLPIDPSHDDPTILRSVLYSPARQEWDFGEEAIAKYYDMGAEGRIFRSLKKFLPDPFFSGTQVHGIFHSLEDLLGRLMRTIRVRAEQHLGQDLQSVILGHPALFSPQPELHQQALNRLEKAAHIAGFKEVAFCPEPVAAAHHFASSLDQPRTVLIADFGGGTSDFTIVRMRPEGFAPTDVLALGGLSVAGDAFDGSIMEHVVAPHFGSKIEYRMPFSSNVLSLPKAMVRKMCSPADLLLLGRQDYLEFFRKLDDWSVGQDDGLILDRLRILVEERQGYHLFQCIEEGKKALATMEVGPIDYEYPGIDLHLGLPRDAFRQFSAPLVQAIMKNLDQTVQLAGLQYGDIDIVCCTGGTARLGAIHEALAQRLGEDKLQQHMPFHAVINGLAERAVQLARASAV
jgi:hypothetical chaperone protein